MIEAQQLTVQESELLSQWNRYLLEYQADAYQDLVLEWPRDRSLTIEFRDLQRADPDLADMLLERPAQVLRVGTGAMRALDTPAESPPDAHLRVERLPEDMRILPRQLRSEHLGRLVPVEGLVQAQSEVRNIPKESAWECKRCSNLEYVMQDEDTLQEPVVCGGCENAGPWRLRDGECTWMDSQILIVQERPDQLRGGASPESRYVLCRDDLVHGVEAGDHVVVNCIPVPRVRRAHGTAKSTEFDTVLMAISIERPHHVYTDTDVTPEQRERFQDLAAAGDVLDVLAASYMPHIVGMEEIKRALIYALVGAPDRSSDGKLPVRGNIHVLLVGDPGIAKSQLIRGMEDYAPRCTIAVGTNTSGAGLAAAAQQDRVMGKWILEAGAAVLADEGVCGIDEMGHIPPEDLHHLHTIMEEGVVRYNKVIKAVLRANTTIIGAMNPPIGERFDPYVDVSSQIGLEAALLSRFDLVYCLQDRFDEDQDRIVAGGVLGRCNGMAEQLQEAPLSADDLRRYITLARTLRPHLTTEAVQLLQDYYVKLRNATQDRPGITPRNVDGLARLARSSARIRLSEDADVDDARAAIEMMEGSLRSRGAINDDGVMDADVLVTGASASMHDRMRLVLQIVKDLQREHGSGYNRGWARQEDVVDRARGHGLNDQEAENCLETLMRNNTLYARGGGGTYAVLSS